MDRSWGRSTGAAMGLGIAGLLLGVGGNLHPDGAGDDEHAQMASMLHDAMWGPSHALILLGLAVLLVSLVSLIRALSADWEPVVRRTAWVAAGATIVSIAEMVPHLLSTGDVHALEAGASTPLIDFHTALQVIATPALGLSFATLAVLSAPGRALGPGRVLAVVAVLGGLAYGAAGPLVVLVDTSYAVLFPGLAGIALWLVAAGVLLVRRLRTPAAVPSLVTNA